LRQKQRVKQWRLLQQRRQQQNQSRDELNKSFIL
jgi:hypothetical protein